MCIICYCWFFDHGSKVKDSICNGCDDLAILSLNLTDIAFITVKGINYRCIHNIPKSDAINLLKSSVLEDRECMSKKSVLKTEAIWSKEKS